MTRAHFAGIFFIVLKILFVEQPVFVANQPVFSHLRRVKFQLELYIFGNGKQGSTKFAHQHFLCFLQIIYV